jgi:hypothetical protein
MYEGQVKAAIWINVANHLVKIYITAEQFDEISIGDTFVLMRRVK